MEQTRENILRRTKALFRKDLLQSYQGIAIPFAIYRLGMLQQSLIAYQLGGDWHPSQRFPFVSSCVLANGLRARYFCVVGKTSLFVLLSAHKMPFAAETAQRMILEKRPNRLHTCLLGPSQEPVGSHQKDNLKHCKDSYVEPIARKDSVEANAFVDGFAGEGTGISPNGDSHKL